MFIYLSLFPNKVTCNNRNVETIFPAWQEALTKLKHWKTINATPYFENLQRNYNEFMQCNILLSRNCMYSLFVKYKHRNARVKNSWEKSHIIERIYQNPSSKLSTYCWEMLNSVVLYEWLEVWSIVHCHSLQWQPSAANHSQHGEQSNISWRCIIVFCRQMP